MRQKHGWEGKPEQPNICSFCNKTFTQKSSLTRHLKHIHNTFPTAANDVSLLPSNSHVSISSTSPSNINSPAPFTLAPLQVSLVRDKSFPSPTHSTSTSNQHISKPWPSLSNYNSLAPSTSPRYTLSPQPSTSTTLSPQPSTSTTLPPYMSLSPQHSTLTSPPCMSLSPQPSTSSTSPPYMALSPQHSPLTSPPYVFLSPPPATSSISTPYMSLSPQPTTSSTSAPYISLSPQHSTQFMK
ncbi:mucin-7-like [Ctenocephalides felis]|uniref:mucin-7-like n=1 Tax=Ctenocephalides felis TaxID=7515 RepID=UPI000E6E4E65|nr:mucin-7-like [Ctenocephalides felis]